MSTPVGTFRTRLQRLHALPPLSAVAQEILRVFADDEAEIEEVERVLGLDPGLAARIVGLANAAYYGQQGRIQTLRSAIIISLGLKLVKDVALALALAQSFHLRSGRVFSAEKYWLRAVMVARAAAVLAAEIDPDASAPAANTARGERTARAYLAGLLHQLGVAALAWLDLDALDRVVQECHGLGGIRADCEIHHLGLTHAELGAMLGESWSLPRPILTVIAHYRDETYAGPCRELVRTVQLACLAHDMLMAEEAGLPACVTPHDDNEAAALQAALETLRGEREQFLAMATLMAGGSP